MTKLVCLVVICMVVVGSSPGPVAAITCGQVSSSIGQCLPYAKGKGPLTSGCCNGIKSLNAAAKTKADRQQTCNCLKAAAKTPGINFNVVAGIPGKCGVSVPYKISPSTDCSRVN